VTFVHIMWWSLCLFWAATVLFLFNECVKEALKQTPPANTPQEWEHETLENQS
jgi:hypothetical protein